MGCGCSENVKATKPIEVPLPPRPITYENRNELREMYKELLQIRNPIIGKRFELELDMDVENHRKLIRKY